MDHDIAWEHVEQVADEAARNPSQRDRLLGLLKTARPRQWVKNGVLLAALVFSGKMFNAQACLQAAGAFISFVFLSSAVYYVNDLLDLERDRHHPKKRSRPIASGLVHPKVATAVAFCLFALSTILASRLSPGYRLAAVAYASNALTYSLWLKHIAIADVLSIALGFVLRAVAGAAAIRVPVSPWLLLCTISLAMFLALHKRRAELCLLSRQAGSHRPVLNSYSQKLLEGMLSTVTTLTVVTYALYSWFSSHPARLIWTTPLVIFGVFRYQLIAEQKGLGESPDQALFTDSPLLGAVLLWLLVSMVVLYV